MQIDSLTLAALRDELESTLLGARIDDIVQPTPAAVALLCWGGGRNRWLLLSAHPRFARVQLVDAKPRKMANEPPAFVMLLRKYLEGARIVTIAQPRWERIIEFGCARGPEAASGRASLWLTVELMGKLSNIILRTADGTILGALRTVGADVNRYRTIAPHAEYRSPPPQRRTLGGATLPKLDGARVTPGDLRAAAEMFLADLATPQAEPTGHQRGRKRASREAPNLATFLAAQIEGFGRDLGREVAARAVGDADAALTPALPWEGIAAATTDLATLLTTHAWTPTLVYAPASATAANTQTSHDQHDATGEDVAPMAFAVYAPAQFAGYRLERAPSVNAMLATYFAGAEWRESVDEAKSGLRHILRTQIERCQRKAQALATELAALGEAQQLRAEADLLLAFQRDVPNHASSVTLPDPMAPAPDGSTPELSPLVTLTLDPRLTAVENANRRYARYHKLQRAAALIPPQIGANDLEMARLAQLETDLALAEVPAEIALVRAEVAEAGYLRTAASATEREAYAKATRTKGNKAGKAKAGARGGKPNKAGKGAPTQRKPEGGTPLRRQSTDGITLLIGKNSRQNEEVTFHQASANDIWLHARGVPGAHVIIKSGGRPVPETTLREAASLAAYYSQARTAGSVPIDYTEQRYVRHMKGGGPGMVIYEREHTIHAAPADHAQSVVATR